MHELETAVSQATPTNGVHVVVRGNAITYTHWLPEGESVIIGSDEQCRIRIIDPSISARQCLIQLRADEIFVHDWGAKHPTLVNGRPADSSIALSTNDRIMFADFTLVFDDAVDDNDPTAEEHSGAVKGDREAQQKYPVESDRLFTTEDSWDELTTEGEPTFAPVAEVSVESSTMELLTSELESLQAELSEKNAIIAEYAKQPPSYDGACAPSELERRIELLLFELDQSDQRVSALEEAMRLSEDAHDAELEEKRQLEAWVDDIEERVAARELEVSAEYEVLRRRLEQATHDRKQAEGRVTSLIDDGSEGALQGMVQVLRHENEQLRGTLEQQSRQVITQEKEIKELRLNSSDEAIQRRIAESLRAERLELAQERAAMSRQQRDMSAKINGLKQQIEKRAQLNPADEKFRAFRGQLKELHEEEKREYTPPTLTQRLANVWRKLDGPTDTD